jgi:hypothetical protein
MAIPGSRIADDRLIVPVGEHEVTVTIAPRPGVICTAELTGFDGYALQVTADGAIAELPVGDRINGVLDIYSNDRELTWALLDHTIRPHLASLRGGRSLIFAGDQLRVHGTAPAQVAGNLALAVARIAARPHELAARVAQIFRRLGGVASGARWNCVDYRIALPTAPPVAVDWPRSRGGLVTRFRVETTERLEGFVVVDSARAATPPGVALPLDVPDVRAGRYLVIAHSAGAVAAACTRLEAALRPLADALPHQVAVTPSGVEIVFAGFEEQTVALIPAVTLARALAGRSAQSTGPYR